jgi:hypothetical protein
LWIREQHAEWGAKLAEEGGCSPLVVRLIRYHQRDVIELKEGVERRLLKQLQWADGSN